MESCCAPEAARLAFTPPQPRSFPWPCVMSPVALANGRVLAALASLKCHAAVKGFHVFWHWLSCKSKYTCIENLSLCLLHSNVPTDSLRGALNGTYSQNARSLQQFSGFCPSPRKHGACQTRMLGIGPKVKTTRASPQHLHRHGKPTGDSRLMSMLQTARQPLTHCQHTSKCRKNSILASRTVVYLVFVFILPTRKWLQASKI